MSHSRLFSRFDILSPAQVKRRESFVGAREHGDLGAILIELAAGQSLHGHAVGERVKIGTCAAAT